MLLAAMTLLAASTGADARVKAKVEEIAPAIAEIRHQIHQNPELGNREEKTAALVASHLRSLGLEVKTGIAHTGVVGVLRGGRPGPLVAMRADMDALPVVEDTPFPFKSTVRASYLGQDVGVAHACGHDIHVSVELGVASVLSSMKADLPGTVQFIFQPAEEGVPPAEGPAGAELMLREGIWKDARPAAVFGLHTRPELEVGQLGYRPGPTMAAADRFRALVKGRQAHASRPDVAVDPVVMASEVVLALQTIRSRNTPLMSPVVLTVGIIRGGQRNNIIPAEVELQGTVRTFEAPVQDLVERRMREILDGVTRAHGGGYTLEYERGYPVTANDAALVEKTLPSLRRSVGEASVQLMDPIAGAEDFSFYARETPGFFYFLGTTKPGTTSGGWHTPTYTGDDSAIPVGIRTMSFVLLDYLQRESRR